MPTYYYYYNNDNDTSELDAHKSEMFFVGKVLF